MIRTVPIAKVPTWTALIAALSFASVTHAESLRCGNKLALPGDTRLEVRAKCGEPSDVIQSTLVRRSGRSGHHGVSYFEEEAVAIPVEMWTYNLGSHRFIYRLCFVNGILDGVETLGYGFDDEATQ
jgi:hypothetical protein